MYNEPKLIWFISKTACGIVGNMKNKHYHQKIKEKNKIDINSLEAKSKSNFKFNLKPMAKMSLLGVQ